MADGIVWVWIIAIDRLIVERIGSNQGMRDGFIDWHWYANEYRRRGMLLACRSLFAGFATRDGTIRLETAMYGAVVPDDNLFATRLYWTSTYNEVRDTLRTFGGSIGVCIRTGISYQKPLGTIYYYHFVQVAARERQWASEWERYRVSEWASECVIVWESGWLRHTVTVSCESKWGRKIEDKWYQYFRSPAHGCQPKYGRRRWRWRPPPGLWTCYRQLPRSISTRRCIWNAVTFCSLPYHRSVAEVQK